MKNAKSFQQLLKNHSILTCFYIKMFLNIRFRTSKLQFQDLFSFISIKGVTKWSKSSVSVELSECFSI